MENARNHELLSLSPALCPPPPPGPTLSVPASCPLFFAVLSSKLLSVGIFAHMHQRRKVTRAHRHRPGQRFASSSACVFLPA